MRKISIVMLIACLSPLILHGQVRESDSLALVALFHSTNGESWTDNTNWLQAGQPVSSWYGIRVHDTIVEHISLYKNNLTGTLPEEIGDLSHLIVLELKMNQISGEIPASIGSLTEIQILSLRSNQFTGSIPPEIGNLTNLEHLYLFENQLDGPIPSEIGNLVKLDYLLLQNNQLTGAIPAEFGQLTNLTLLSLSTNLLTDSIPAGVGNLTKLTELRLSRNELTGNIPAEIGNLTQLTLLDLAINKLSGAIPQEIGNLTGLSWVGLHRNQLEGSIPSGIGNLVQLTSLSLRNNELSGPIPPEIGNLSNLQYLFLYGNQLSSLPVQIGNLKNLKRLNLGYNELQGIIPKEIGDLDSLEVLSMKYNQLSGSIPVEIGKLKKLGSLQLQYNQLEGSLPDELGNLTSLETIDLCNNGFEGPIPHEVKDLPFLSIVRLGSNRFNFYDLEPLIGKTLSTFYYTPQAPLELHTTQINQSTGDDLDVDITSLTFNQCAASNNQYQWWKDGVYVSSLSDSPVLNLSGLDSWDEGGYICTMINADFPDLILASDTIDLVMDGPVDVTLNPESIDENIPSGSLVGILTASDSDQPEGHSFALTESDGILDADNDSFTLKQDSLIINISPDFETKNEYHIYVTSTDNDSKTFSKALVVYINDVQEATTSTTNTRQAAQWKVYPNPAGNYLIIELELPVIGPVSIELIDVYGKLVQTYQYGTFMTGGKHEERMYMNPAVSPGIYFVIIRYNNLKKCISVIKE